jgi:hypothetical protein
MRVRHQSSQLQLLGISGCVQALHTCGVFDCLLRTITMVWPHDPIHSQMMGHGCLLRSVVCTGTREVAVWAFPMRLTWCDISGPWLHFPQATVARGFTG